MTESHKIASTGLILRISSYLLVLTLLLVFALAVLTGCLYRFANASIASVIVLVAADLALAAAAVMTIRVLARLSGAGYCGFWNHCEAVQWLYRQSFVLIAVSLVAMLAIWMA